jgi:hypothetical protein
MTTKTHLQVMSDQEARDFMRAWNKLSKRDRLQSCTYGHLDCSIYGGGPCLDETLGRYPQADPYYP